MVPIPRQQPGPRQCPAQRPAQSPTAAQVAPAQPPAVQQAAFGEDAATFHAYFEGLCKDDRWDYVILSTWTLIHQVVVLYYVDGKPTNQRRKTNGYTWIFGGHGSLPLVQMHGVPQAILFGKGEIVKFIAATPPTMSLLVKTANVGGGSEVGHERDATKPSGHLTWGNRTMADHSSYLLW